MLPIEEISRTKNRLLGSDSPENNPPPPPTARPMALNGRARIPAKIDATIQPSARIPQTRQNDPSTSCLERPSAAPIEVSSNTSAGTASAHRPHSQTPGAIHS